MFRVEIKRIPCNDAGEAEILPQEFESKWTHYKALLFLGNKNDFLSCIHHCIDFKSHHCQLLADHMRSRRTQYNIMDPIQKMEVLDSYPVMLNGYSAPNRQINGDTETLPASTINPSANVVKCDPDTQVKHNKRRNSIPESLTDETSATFPLPESSSEHKRRKINTFDASANSSENGDKLINDDYHFLMSLQPFMSELSRTQKLRLRMKMQKLVFDELYGNIDM